MSTITSGSTAKQYTITCWMKQHSSESLTDRSELTSLKWSKDVVYIDCTGLKDPDESNKRYHRHCGVHEKILEGIYESKGLDKVIAQYEGCIDPSKDGKPKR